MASSEPESSGFYDASKEDASEFAGRVCRESWGNSPFVKVISETDYFRSKRRWVYKDLPLPLYPQDVQKLIQKRGGSYFSEDGYSETGGPDGIGTAVEFANALRIYNKSAFNLLAMSADDVGSGGDLATVFMNVVDYSTLQTDEQKKAYAELFEGLGRASKENDVVIFSGESAGLRNCVGSSNPDALFPFNWSGVMNGISHANLQITGNNVKAGDVIVAFKQGGFATNGITKVREALARKYGPLWFKTAPESEVRAAMTPPVIYARGLAEANGWYNNGQKLVDMTSINHLSGGSFKSKFLESLLLRLGLSARLDSLYEIPAITKSAIEWLTMPFDSIATAKVYGKDSVDPSPMTLQEVFTTWCDGQRMLVTLKDEKAARDLIQIVDQFGIKGTIAGEVIETPKGQRPHLQITAKFEGDERREEVHISA